MRNLHDYQLRLLNSSVSPPSGHDVANTLKYFSQMLLGIYNVRLIDLTFLSIIDPTLITLNIVEQASWKMFRISLSSWSTKKSAIPNEWLSSPVSIIADFILFWSNCWKLLRWSKPELTVITRITYINSALFLNFVFSGCCRRLFQCWDNLWSARSCASCRFSNKIWSIICLAL